MTDYSHQSRILVSINSWRVTSENKWESLKGDSTNIIKLWMYLKRVTETRCDKASAQTLQFNHINPTRWNYNIKNL